MQHHFTTSPISDASRKPVKILANGRLVGEVEGGVFRKTLIRRKHFLRKNPELHDWSGAIAFDCQSLLDAERAGAATIQITDETGTVYTAPIADVWRYGRPDPLGALALGLHRWITRKAKPPAQQLPLL